MGKARDALLSGLVLLLGRRRRPPRSAARIIPDEPPNPRAELVVAALLFAGALLAAGFIVFYAVSGIGHRTQYLGLTLGLSLLAIAGALIVFGQKVIVTEEIVEPYTANEHPHEAEVVAQVVEESGDRISRRRLLTLGAGAAGTALTFAAIAPALSFGPFFQDDYFLGTPWRKGKRLVLGDSTPIRAADIDVGSYYTAFPEGLSLDGREELGSSVVVIRLPKAQLHLPSALTGYDADGIMAYSKICTHAGCAVSMYRTPLFQPDEPAPALVCPCHYSTFDVATGGTVIFGPAGRPLPMLPLSIDPDGYLRATGNFDGQVGPAWWGTYMWKPNP